MTTKTEQPLSGRTRTRSTEPMPGQSMAIALDAAAEAPARRAARALGDVLTSWDADLVLVYAAGEHAGWSLLAQADKRPRSEEGPRAARVRNVLTTAATEVLTRACAHATDLVLPSDHAAAVWGCISAEPREPESQGEHLALWPIRVTGDVWGAVLVATRSALGDEAKTQLRHVLSLGAEGLGAALALERNEADARHILSLQRLTEELAAIDTVTGIAQAVVNNAYALLRARGVAILMFDRTGTTLDVVHAAGMPWRTCIDGTWVHIKTRVHSAAPSMLEHRARDARQAGQFGDAEWEPSTQGDPLDACLVPSGAPHQHVVEPLFARGSRIGVFAMLRDEHGAEARSHRDVLDDVIHQCSLALERCLRFKEEAAARTRAANLQRVTASLASARSLDAVASRVVESITDALGAPMAWIAVFDRDTSNVSLTKARGIDPSVLARGLKDPRGNTLLRCFATVDTPHVFSDHESFHEACSTLSELTGGSAYEASAVIPISGGRRVLAIAGLRFRAPSAFDNDVRTLMHAISVEAAHAIERALLQDAERRARQHLTFLLDASRLLSASLNVEETLHHLGGLVVSRIADWCSVDVMTPEKTLQNRVLVHRDPSKQLAGKKLRSRLSERFESWVLDTAVRTRRAILLSPARGVDEVGISKDELDELLSVGVNSMLVVPLIGGGELTGVMALAVGADRHYGVEDLALAEELAQRAAVALENARQHEELELARADAERANRVKDEFVAMLGHELRNPLMPILTVVELMRLHGEHAHAREWSVVERQGRHLLRLVDDLLDVARITRGKVKLRRRPVEAHHIVTRALETTSPELESRRHEVIVECARTGLVVDGDEDRLVQVVANLLTNAARYTDPGGRVHIDVCGDDDAIMFRVVDSGTGLSSEMLARIFDAFVQGPRPIDRAQGGLGLGLAIVKNIVELHGGSVKAMSDGPGRGSTFAVRLPRASATPALPVRALNDAVVKPRRAQRILVVDDNVDAAETLSEALRLQGHEVRVAYDGPAALAMVTSFDPDVALLDIGLPVMDGYELAGELIAILGDQLFLVAVTGYGQPSDVERAREAGFHHHFTKPVDLESLATLLDQHRDDPTRSVRRTRGVLGAVRAATSTSENA